MDGLSVYLITVLLFCWFAGEPEKLAPPPPRVAPAEAKATAILLPEADGKASGIVIRTMGQETTVTEPYQGVELSGGKVESRTYSAEEIQRLYPEVMHALPEKPRSFILHFVSNGTELTAESGALIQDILQEVGRRAAPEISVIGHTDREGSDEANLRLSQGRAEKVRGILIGKGVPAQIIQAIGRGELEPLVPTPDGVAEPHNRRVEISIR